MRITNDLLQRYCELREIISKSEKEFRALREAILVSGGAQTKDYFAFIKTLEREFLAPVSKFEEKIGRRILVQEGLIYKSQYKAVLVTSKLRTIDSDK